MKVTFTIDCTPEEAREFFGLPEVKPMQDAMLKKIEERMSATVDVMAPESLLKTWLPAGVQGVEQLQKMFWGSFVSANRRPAGDA